MNRQGPGKIDWTDYTWNPVTGCWGPGGSPEAPGHCPYCYAKRMYERFGKSFEPRFHPQQLLRPGKMAKPGRIFVCSVADLFGAWVPDDWIEQVLHVARVNPQHTFQFLTKWPERLGRWNGSWGANCWVGATATDEAEMTGALAFLGEVDAPVRFISAEPLLGPLFPGAGDGVRSPLADDIRRDPRLSLGIDWLIIGAMTGPGAVKPEPGWVDDAVTVAHAAGIPVWLKGNLKYSGSVQEWPGGAR